MEFVLVTNRQISQTCIFAKVLRMQHAFPPHKTHSRCTFCLGATARSGKCCWMCYGNKWP